MRKRISRLFIAGPLFAGLLVTLASPVLSAEKGAKLFTFVSEKDEIVAALTKEDALLGDDATAIGKALRERGAMTVWRYAVRKAKDGELEQAPLAKISVQAQGNLRVEPYRTPLRVVPVE
ncbi:MULTISPECIES: hypothetical protein [unclassified Chelatococcus]|uniref:hypothetical protein n=1 Tax=unclassified Chelatococcus TaxID=2638111 RepID=UPI001BCE5C1C|nr:MULTISPECIES: hypothetical protein [unclassified Chelatococcus]MBS7699434.1 hypothetical protein [Chelatococcus sp. YT9]MBX3557674.1 hypothetical protein [Chelatococcus sp.]